MSPQQIRSWPPQESTSLGVPSRWVQSVENLVDGGSSSYKWWISPHFLGQNSNLIITIDYLWFTLIYRYLQYPKRCRAAELFIFISFFAAGFGLFFGFLVLFFPASLLLCFSASAFLLLCFLLFLLLCLSTSLLFCFSAFLLLCLFCFSASLLFCFLLFLLLCFSALPASFLFCFSASLLSLLLCFSASVPFYFYYSTFSFLQSCVFAAILPAPLLLCFLSLLPLCFFPFCFILSCLYPEWNPKDPRWNRNPDKNSWYETPTWNPKSNLKKP